MLFQPYDILFLSIIFILTIFYSYIWLEKIWKIFIINNITIIIILNIYILLNIINSNILFTINIDIKNYLSIINLIIYFIFMITYLLKSKSNIFNIENKFINFIFTLLLSPIISINTLYTLLFISYWIDIINYNKIIEIYNQFSSFIILKYFIILFPLGYIIPSILFLLFTLDIKLEFRKKE